MTLCHAHVGGHHYKPLAVPRPTDESISLSALDACMLFGVDNSTSANNVLIVITVATQCIGRIFAMVAHVTIKVAIVALLHVLGQSGQRCYRQC